MAYRRGSDNIIIEDGQATHTESLSSYYGFTEYNDLSQALLQKPGIAFICNPSSLHLSTALQCAEAGCHLFIEKPAATSDKGMDELLEKTIRRNLITMVGFQTRFHPCIQEVHGLIASQKYGRLISATFNWSTYLPAHHPYENFRGGYAARHDLGGGVTFCLSHELDLIQYFFGVPQSVYAVGGHLSDLEMDVDDTVAALFRYKDGSRSVPVQLHLSFAQGEERREATILMDHGVIFYNLITNEISVINHHQELLIHHAHPHLTRNKLFLEEARYFLECIKNRQQTQASLKEAGNSLLMCLAIHRSLQTKRPECIELPQELACQ